MDSDANFQVDSLKNTSKVSFRVLGMITFWFRFCIHMSLDHSVGGCTSLKNFMHE